MSEPTCRWGAWYPGDIGVTAAEAYKDAEAGLGMWEKWQKTIKDCGGQYARSPVFIAQGHGPEAYKRAAEYLSIRQLVDLDGKTRDIAFGSNSCDTCLGKVTRAWLDSNVEVDFMRRHLPGLAGMDVLDVGAGYGRLAVSMSPLVKSFTCTDGIQASLEACRDYTSRFTPGVKVFSPGELKGTFDLALNIHSWPECSLSQIEVWLDLLKALNVPWLFLVPHEETYGIWSKERVSFRPLIERDFELMVQECIGMDPCWHYMWRRKLQ